jgi:hypothetical protein
MATFYRAVLSCFLLLTAFVKPVRASHILGGELTYTADTTAAKNPLRYFFKLVTYNDGQSAAENLSAIIHLGDGVSLSSERTSKILITNACGKVYKNTYYFAHTFPGPGQYTVMYSEVDRSRSIVNIAYAEEQLFTIYAKISVDIFDAVNATHRPLLPPIFCATLNQPFRHSLGAADPDGDSLVYELITPVAATTTAGTAPIHNVVGYNLPDQVNLNARTGELVWLQPKQLGTYTFAVRVSQYHNRRLAGSYVRDFNVNVVPPETLTQAFTIENRAELPINDQNQLLLTVSQPLTIKVKYQTSAAAQSVQAFTDLFYQTPLYTLDTATSGSTGTAVFTITPAETWRRRQPYLLVFRGTAAHNDGLAQQDLTLTLLTQPETISGGGGDGGGDQPGEPADQPTALFTVYPNPADTFFRVKNNQQTPGSKVMLYNDLSQLVLKKALNQKITYIKLIDINFGIYFYQIVSENNQLLQSGKLLIE